jgi:hypothetical protein
LRAETLRQTFHEAAIKFDSEHFIGFVQKQFGERPQSGSDFEHFVGGRELCSVDDAPELVAIVQKILAERFGELDVALG